VLFIFYDYGNCIHRSYTGIDSLDYSLFPNREYQLRWMRASLEESAALKEINRSLVSEADVESLYQEVQHFVPVCSVQNTFACNILYIVCIEVLNLIITCLQPAI